MVNKILAIGNYEVDEATISKTLQIAWESQQSEVTETIPLCEEMNAYTNRFFADLVEGMQD